MRHRKKRHLRGSRDRRRKELRALVKALVLYEAIETTAARAKLTRSAAEKMVSKGKKASLAARRLLLRDLPENAVRKIFEVLSPRYKERRGGYTRVLKIGKYKNGTPKVRLEFVK